MNKIILSTTFASLMMLGGISSVAYAVTPCEDMLKDVRATEKTAKLSADDAQKVADLESKGIERCNADDDKRADDFFAQPLKIMGK